MSFVYSEGISVKDYNKLREAVGWGILNEEQAQAGINNSKVFSCSYNNEVIGTARVIWDGGYVAYIADVMVLPEYQSKGIGRALITRIKEYIKSQLKEGWEMMLVLVSAKGKEEFYKKFGFDQRPNGSLGCGMSQWIYG